MYRELPRKSKSKSACSPQTGIAYGCPTSGEERGTPRLWARVHPKTASAKTVAIPKLRIPLAGDVPLFLSGAPITFLTPLEMLQVQVSSLETSETKNRELAQHVEGSAAVCRRDGARFAPPPISELSAGTAGKLREFGKLVRACAGDPSKARSLNGWMPGQTIVEFSQSTAYFALA
jgi:hypothetical protein